jgi:hypothetical protein
LVNFDAPDANLAVSRRNRSNTPLQALNLLNDPVFVEAAQALAMRILDESPADLDRRLEYAFELCLNRQPTPGEKQVARESFRNLKSVLDRGDAKAARQLVPVETPSVDPVEAAAWVGFSRAMLNTDEFITRE